MADILYSRDGDVAVIRLNRPGELNAVTLGMLDQMAKAFVDAADSGARAVLVTGEGRAFCAGAALGDGKVGQDLGENLRHHYNPVAKAMADLPIPIVSAVNGPAAGAGVSYALGADLVIAAHSAYFLLAFANIGLVPDAGATWLVGRGAGRAKLLEMALLGERLSAQDALEAGLITRVVDDAVVFETALEFAHKLAAKPTLALGMIRRQAKSALAGTLEESLALEAEHQARVGASLDFREGVAAFLEKREPIFIGR